MREHVPIRLGPLALLLTVVSLCLTVLAVLTFSTARADLSLARRYAETVKTRYALECRGQEALQAAQAGLSGETDENGVLWQTFEAGDLTLTVGLTQGEDGVRVVSWKHQKLWQEDDEMENLWTGF